MATAAVARRAEIKTRTSDEVINTFLIKSIEVGGLPFDLRPEAPSYDAIASVAYRAPLNAEGVAVLPAEWDDGDE